MSNHVGDAMTTLVGVKELTIEATVLRAQPCEAHTSEGHQPFCRACIAAPPKEEHLGVISRMEKVD